MHRWSLPDPRTRWPANGDHPAAVLPAPAAAPPAAVAIALHNRTEHAAEPFRCRRTSNRQIPIVRVGPVPNPDEVRCRGTVCYVIPRDYRPSPVRPARSALLNGSTQRAPTRVRVSGLRGDVPLRLNRGTAPSPWR